MYKIKFGWHKNRKTLEKVYFKQIQDLGDDLFEICFIDTFGYESIFYLKLEDYLRVWKPLEKSDLKNQLGYGRIG